MQVEKDRFIGRPTTNKISWEVVGTTECPSLTRLAVRRFTARSVVFVDVATNCQYYASLRIANKVLMAQQGLGSWPFMCVQKHSTDGKDCTWIGEVTY